MLRHAIGLVALGLAAGTASAQALTAGQWEITSTVTDVKMPGAPPQVVAMMKGKPTTIRHCVTPQEAASGPREMLKRDKSCSFSRYSASGGKFDAVMTCKQQGGTMTVTSTGTYSPTAYSSSARLVMTGGTAMTMSVTGSGKRVGACK